MKITDIDLYTVDVPVKPLIEGGISPYAQFHDKVGRKAAIRSLFKVKTDEGIVGWGEMTPFISHKVMEVLLEEFIKPRVIGMDPFDIKKIAKKFEPKYTPHLNTKGFMPGIEVACWDIMGKALNKPIYKLLGGKVRDTISVAYCLGLLGIEETKEKIQQIKSQGFQTLKTKAGLDLNFDVQRTKAIREAGGPDFEIRIDMNQGCDIIQALRYIKQIEKFDLQYIEQPIRINDFDNLKRLRLSTNTPIGIDEDCCLAHNLFSAIKEGCIDVGIIDYERLGGISELVRLANIAEEANIPLVHHCSFDLGIKLAAILHVTSTLHSFRYAMDSTYFAHEKDILKERIKVEEGHYIIPEGPGLGVEVDEEKIKDLTLNSIALRK